MTAMVTSISKPLGKTLLGQTSAKKGIVVNMVTGTGVGNTLRAVDNIVGSPLQRIFSLPLPVIGTVGPLDLINYVIHTGGRLTGNVTSGLSAVVGDKVISGGLGSLAGSLPIPGVSQVANPNVTPSGPGAPL